MVMRQPGPAIIKEKEFSGERIDFNESCIKLKQSEINEVAVKIIFPGKIAT